MANNHVFDYGEEGLRDTLKTCKDEGVATVGAGFSLR
ncbi:CapA family protein, partial [Stutzerimonas stutzeri]